MTSPIELSADARMAGKQLHDLYLALVQQGFTTSQAMDLLLSAVAKPAVAK